MNTAPPLPFLSVLIPTWNRVEPVLEAIRSVGDHPDVEIVVVDNGSEPAVYDRLARETAAFPAVHLFRNEQNLGMVRNWNRCIGHATGTWMSLLCSDDVFLPGSVDRARELLSEQSSPVMVVSDPSRSDGVTRLPAGSDTVRALRLPIASGNVWHREIVGKVGGFDERFEYSADAEYWYRCALHFPTVVVREPYANYNRHENNYMWATWEKANFLDQTRLLARTVHRYMHPGSTPAEEEKAVGEAGWKTLLTILHAGIVAGGKRHLVFRYLPQALREASSAGRIARLLGCLAVATAVRIVHTLKGT